ncbi:MAG: hypothetical protein KGL52_03800 [Rhodospirillales bacterium]|jgi:hypothetical protein|nr:hypothetical protein [Rhodospirillales bacterium]
MRTLRLARVAVEAETLRLRRVARGMAGRAVRASLALPFLLVGLGFLEVALWLYLDGRLKSWAAALVMAGANLALALLLALPALLRPAEDRIAREAAEVRRQAVAAIEERLRLGAAAVDLVQALAAFVRRRTPP